MNYEFDEAKDQSNRTKHGLSLADVHDFDWETAVVTEDIRVRYAEPRYAAAGLIGDRLHIVVYCLREETIRIISLRKANAREVKRYANHY